MDLDSYAPIQRELVLELPSDLDSIEHAVEFVMRRCQPCGAGAERLRLNFRVGLTEALSNAIRYGNGTDPHKRVRMEIEVRQCSLTARITDEGHGFDRPENNLDWAARVERFLARHLGGREEPFAVVEGTSADVRY